MSTQRVLILNQDYSALTICSAQRAFLLVYMQKAEMVANAKQFMLRTVSTTFPMPSVIRLNGYVRLPYRGVLLNRQNIFRRDNHKCQYCNSTQNLTIDHVMPRSRGGKASWDNLVTACRMCNSRKGDHTPEEAMMPLKQKPFKPSFLLFLRDFSGNIDEQWYPFLGKASKSNKYYTDQYSSF
ncbi:MAG: HNH endonuclease [Bacteroidota bacterium]|nr:HNH endonuclease [Bacteroidota bacterium]